jgi:ATP-dependent DNA helicase RecG
MPQLTLETPLFEVVGARSPSLRRLEKMGIKTVGDLLWHFPARYEDFTKTYTVAELEPGQQATLRGRIEDIRTRHSFRRHMSIVEATIADASGSIRAVWFNQPYVATTLKPGREANFSGKASVSDEGEIYLNNPTYEIVRVRPGMRTANADGANNTDGASDNEQEFNHTGRLVPIYPETQGLTSRGIRFVIQQLFKHQPELEEWIPAEVLAEFHFAELEDALHEIHFPRTIEEAAAARARFSFEDLFLLQLITLREKMKLATVHAPAMTVDIEWVKELLAKLPFELTPSQKKSLWEIIQDMERAHPMNRLLQGDVGSGKTIVAALAALIAARNGFQTAFMAPTEILARQHFETMKKVLKFFENKNEIKTSKKDGATNPSIGLLTSANATIDYGDGLEELRITKAAFNTKSAAGEVAIIFGTHALIQKTAAFKNLGLVVIDEQHRFGVSQRAELLTKTTVIKGGTGTKANNGTTAQALAPHFLSMSATPIPRTLMLSIFGDLDLSLITELPSGRKVIQTKIVPPHDRAAAYDFIRSEIKNGRQAFVICPRIDPAEEENDKSKKIGDREVAKSPAKIRALQTALDLKSVKEEFEKLSKKIFPDLRIAMLHGQMKAREKEDVMRKFKDCEYDVIVCTSVVEVGVDVPNATIMMIEGAERFGLAQLYQFRGRVGRGEHQSYCFLMADSAAKAANARLKAILEAKNGFELAEKDLALRGPGQFFGQVQTGLPDVAMEALRDPELVKHSREAAIKILQDDPSFKKTPLLRKKFEEFRAKLHRE